MAERIALIGYGAIGAAVHRLLRAEAPGGSEVIAVLLRPNSDWLKRGASDAAAPPIGDSTARPAAPGQPLFCADLARLLDCRPSLVVECAGHAAVDQHSEAVLAAGCDLMIVSIGALAQTARYDRLRALAARYDRQIVLPSGAIAGIDWLAAAQRSGLDRVTYRSRKPPSAWRGTPAESLVDLDAIDQARTFFSGNARDAALQYPQNANVAATVALAGVGFEATEVQLIADPRAEGNLHEIEASGAVGTLALRVLGAPDPNNPKTSMMTAFSVTRAIINRTAALAL